MSGAFRNVLRPLTALILAYALVLGGVTGGLAGAAPGTGFPVCSPQAFGQPAGPEPAGHGPADHPCCLGACAAASPAILPAVELIPPPQAVALVLSDAQADFGLQRVTGPVSARAPPRGA